MVFDGNKVSSWDTRYPHTPTWEANITNIIDNYDVHFPLPPTRSPQYSSGLLRQQLCAVQALQFVPSSLGLGPMVAFQLRGGCSIGCITNKYRPAVVAKIVAKFLKA